MIRGINSSPVFFAQPLEIENRKRFWCLKRIAEEMRNLLCDRTMLTPCSSLQLLVQGVGKVFDVKDRHALPPKLLQYGGTGRERQAGHSRGPDETNGKGEAEVLLSRRLIAKLYRGASSRPSELAS